MRYDEHPKDPPETLRQAQTWETNKNRYLDAGLCYVCSAQAAWGHQLGFTRVKPPCETCHPVVDKFPFPVHAHGPWRMTLDRAHTRTRLARDAAKATS